MSLPIAKSINLQSDNPDSIVFSGAKRGRPIKHHQLHHALSMADLNWDLNKSNILRNDRLLIFELKIDQWINLAIWRFGLEWIYEEVHPITEGCNFVAGCCTGARNLSTMEIIKASESFHRFLDHQQWAGVPTSFLNLELVSSSDTKILLNHQRTANGFVQWLSSILGQAVGGGSRICVFDKHEDNMRFQGASGCIDQSVCRQPWNIDLN